MTLRVFPRRTNATPLDNMVRFGMPGMFDEADEIKISVTFTYDLKYAEQLYNQWKYVASTTIGGPATGEIEGEFTPGMFLKHGMVITSRGCPNKCWFCSVWKRNGGIRELKINSGTNIMDDNLLACSDQHVKSVFEMLLEQKGKKEFTGGLEAKILKQWHVDYLKRIKPASMFFAYDTEDDYEPLIQAGKMLVYDKDNNPDGFKPTNHQMLCYGLMGYPRDTFEKAEIRMNQILSIGMLPFAMLWKNDKGEENKQWRRFQREWANKFITGSKMKQLKTT